MTVECSIQVYGVRESLKVLGDLGPESRKAAVKSIKAAASPLVELGRRPYPTSAPMSGWRPTGRSGYKPQSVATGVQLQVGGRQPRGADSFAVATLVQKNAGGALFDIAGLRGGTRPGRNGPHPSFLEALNNYGKAQRGLWRMVKPIRDMAYDVMKPALDEVAAAASRKLVE